MSLPQCAIVGLLAVALSSSIFFNIVCWTVLSYVTQVSSVSEEAPIVRDNLLPSIAEHFPQIGGDLTKVKWGHAVNSRSQLNESLQGKVMMIEADILLGTITNDESGKRVPIMAHPPAKTSDLTFEEFIDTIIRSGKRKGVKIDFKDMGAVEDCLKYLRSRAAEITFPLLINADIVEGPVNATTEPLNATQFLALATQYYPDSVLSVGWTTRFGPDVTSWPIKFVNDGHYSFGHVKKMRDVLQGAYVRQPVTFPVRAGLLASSESHRNIGWLLEQIPGSTLTIWSSSFDTVNVKGLMQLITRVGREKVYVDVPSGLLCEIRHYNEVE